MIHRKYRVNICISTNLIQLEQKAYLTIDRDFFPHRLSIELTEYTNILCM